MRGETLEMSRKELDWIRVIEAVSAKRLTQQAAARELALSVRQIKRLVQRYREQGQARLISGHRGQIPGNRLSDAVRQEALVWVRKRYTDFGPTLAGTS